MGKYIDYLDIQEEVKAALEEHRGVVALESTIISHGTCTDRHHRRQNKHWSVTGGFAEAGQCGYCDEGFQKRSGSGSG